MKGLKKCLLLLPLFGLSLTASSLLSSTNASALYGEIPTVNQLNVVSNNGLYSADVSHGGNNSWQIRAKSDTTTKACAYQSQLDTALESGSVAVIQQTPQPRGTLGNFYQDLNPLPKAFVYIIFSTSPSQPGSVMIGDDFTDILVQTNYSNSYYFAMLSIDNNGNYIFTCNQFNYNTCTTNLEGLTNCSPIIVRNYMIYSGAAWGFPNNQTYAYYTTFNIAYPPDWDANTIPTNAPPPPQPGIEIAPDIVMTEMKDFKGTFSDTKFLTFDGYPFMCGEFSPQITIEVFSRTGTEVLLDTLSTSASSQFTYTFPTSPETRDYRIVSYYSCDVVEIEGVGFYDFQINANGNLVSEIPCNAELFCQLNIPTFGLTQAILSPLAFVNSLPHTTCSGLVLPMPHGINNITIPCMTPIYQTYFGPLLLLYQTILTGMFAYYVSLRLFGNVKQITNPRDDQVETVKL